MILIDEMFKLRDDDICFVCVVWIVWVVKEFKLMYCLLGDGVGKVVVVMVIGEDVVEL